MNKETILEKAAEYLKLEQNEYFRNELQNCLEQADLAKFAHRRPGQHNLELMEKAVTTFVKKTEPTGAQMEEKP
mgnify:CR=1 FL=1